MRTFSSKYVQCNKNCMQPTLHTITQCVLESQRLILDNLPYILFSGIRVVTTDINGQLIVCQMYETSARLSLQGA